MTTLCVSFGAVGPVHILHTEKRAELLSSILAVGRRVSNKNHARACFSFLNGNFRKRILHDSLYLFFILTSIKFAFSSALVFLKTEQLFELIGSGFVIVDNFHSQFLV